MMEESWVAGLAQHKPRSIEKQVMRKHRWTIDLLRIVTKTEM
jgi:hypothetical protein